MRTGILLLNFGEPESLDRETVIAFLERIFLLNAPLMGEATEAQIRERIRRMAEERAPSLIAEYEEIGGSPLHRQARDQMEALVAELRARGHDAEGFLGMQFTEPQIESAVAAAVGAGVERIVALPVYPVPGPTTTYAALRSVEAALESRWPEIPIHGVIGWHNHPEYVRFRADAVRTVLEETGLSLEPGSGTRLVFSAHGTPLKYIRDGSRYVADTEELCMLLARELGVSDAMIGYQNHTNRPGLQWTQPDVEEVIAGIDARAVVVDPVSFMHEQSETLAELDHELREAAEARGLAFHRVPIAHAHPRFIRLLADLVEEALEGGEHTGSADAAPTVGRAEAGSL